MWPRRTLLLLALLAQLPASAAVDFVKDIKPIFADRCLDCHGAEEKKGGVDLSSYFGAHRPADSGEAILTPGAAGDALLIHVITATDKKRRMPPKGAALTAEQIATLKRWVAEGAVWPDDGWRPTPHWAYVAPRLPKVPAMAGAGARNSIDAFIDAKLAAEKLTRGPDADPAVQLRRVALDLTGLPPTVTQVDAFLADPSDAGYARLVDQFLASPAFGERWARPWLDAARFADSEGYQRDAERSLWPWRDWVIDALNQDMPFDRFTVEQLAGDLLPAPTLAQKIATGFQRNTPLNIEAGTDPLEDHYKQVVDRVNTLGAVWLGTTLGCAQCHNHKYDPISIVEYYRVFALFNQTPIESRQQGSKMGMAGMVPIGPTVSLPMDEATKKRHAALEQAYKKKEAALLAVLEPKWAALAADPKKFARLPEATQAELELDPSERTFDTYQTVVRAAFRTDQEVQALWSPVAASQALLLKVQPATSRVMQELSEPRPTYVAKRGDFLSPGEKVTGGMPSVLPAWPAQAPVNRLGLARWLVSPDQPLTARVTVNRLWAELFGQGIVSTLEEFGTQGAPPSHPELLDWLAVTFASEDQWSMKRTLRRMVLSATYRQSAAVRADAAARDPADVWLWRHPGQRLDAETIRDNALAISGLLNAKMGGPPVFPWQPEGFWRPTAGASLNKYRFSKDGDQFRRGIYTIWRRTAHYPSFSIFDAPDRNTCSLRRGRSSTPLQALALLNDKAYVEMAAAFARRMSGEFSGSVDQRIEQAFRTALARKPTTSERQQLRKVFEAAVKASGQEADGFVDVATVILNLYETIHRG